MLCCVVLLLPCSVRVEVPLADLIATSPTKGKGKSGKRGSSPRVSPQAGTSLRRGVLGDLE